MSNEKYVFNDLDLTEISNESSVDFDNCNNIEIINNNESVNTNNLDINLDELYDFVNNDLLEDYDELNNENEINNKLSVGKQFNNEFTENMYSTLYTLPNLSQIFKTSDINDTVTLEGQIASNKLQGAYGDNVSPGVKGPTGSYGIKGPTGSYGDAGIKYVNSSLNVNSPFESNEQKFINLCNMNNCPLCQTLSNSPFNNQ